MTIPAHLAGGYLMLQAAATTPLLSLDESTMLLGLIGTVLPDVDTLTYTYVKDHHDSLSHTPLFWLLVFVPMYFVGLYLGSEIIKHSAIALTIGVFSHFVLDWFSGRTAGIRFLYPFSKKRFSLLPLLPDMGKIPIKPTRGQLDFWKTYQKQFWKFYTNNKFLFAAEICVTILGVCMWYLRHKVI